MIRRIKGIIENIIENEVVLEVGPISIGLHVPMSTTYKIKDEISLYIYMHWHQDKGPTLFGFSTQLERDLFLLIISCSGIGPKIGIATLNTLTPESFIEAIQMQDSSMLAKVNGLGIKKAEQIILSLKHKIKKLVDANSFYIKSQKINDFTKITQVLESLNYSSKEVSAAVNYVSQSSLSKKNSFDELMRSALSFLSKRG